MGYWDDLKEKLGLQDNPSPGGMRLQIGEPTILHEGPDPDSQDDAKLKDDFRGHRVQSPVSGTHTLEMTLPAGKSIEDVHREAAEDFLKNENAPSGPGQITLLDGETEANPPGSHNGWGMPLSPGEMRPGQATVERLRPLPPSPANRGLAIADKDQSVQIDKDNAKWLNGPSESDNAPLKPPAGKPQMATVDVSPSAPSPEMHKVEPLAEKAPEMGPEGARVSGGASGKFGALQALLGSTPDDKELRDAKARREAGLGDARFQENMARATSLIRRAGHEDAGKIGPEIGKVSIAGANNGIEDIKMRRENETRKLQDVGETQRQLLEKSKSTRDDEKFSREKALDDPNSNESKSYRVWFKARYPKEAAAMGKDFDTMTVNSLKGAAGELPYTKQEIGGGKRAGSSEKDIRMWSSKLPQETSNIYGAASRIRQMATSAGGFEKMGGVTGLGGLIPGRGLTKEQADFRSEIGGLTSIFLQSKAGKAITSHEERAVLGKIAADPTSMSITPQQLEHAIALIERYTQGNARQAIGPAPDDVKERIRSGAGLPKGYFDQDPASPLGGAQTQTKKGKDGKTYIKTPQGWALQE